MNQIVQKTRLQLQQLLAPPLIDGCWYGVKGPPAFPDAVGWLGLSLAPRLHHTHSLLLKPRCISSLVIACLRNWPMPCCNTDNHSCALQGRVGYGAACAAARLEARSAALCAPAAWQPREHDLHQVSTKQKCGHSVTLCMPRGVRRTHFSRPSRSYADPPRMVQGDHLL
jgi:hypothetical protein